MRFSFRRFLELVLLLGVGIAGGIAIDRWLRPWPEGRVAYVRMMAPAREAGPAPAAAEAAKEPDAPLECSLRSSFDNHLFPSLLLSFAAADPEYTRCLTVAIRGAVKGRSYRIQVESALFSRPAVLTESAPGADFELHPSVPWDYAALRRISQLRPESVTVSVAAERQSAQSTVACIVHPVNEAVSRLVDPGTGNWVDVSICFAAFVNEDHPWINQILQEAMARDGVARFSGYELGPESVVRQMRAIWDALAARGLNYVDLAMTSGAVQGVSTQYVRFLDQSMRDQGANCVDGAVLFASIFRRIGLRPVLVFRPGHCFVAVYDAAQGGQLMAVETTLLSGAPFAQAFSLGRQELANALPHLDTPGYSTVDIAAARQAGVRPIEFAE